MLVKHKYNDQNEEWRRSQTGWKYERYVLLEELGGACPEDAPIRVAQVPGLVWVLPRPFKLEGRLDQTKGKSEHQGEH